MSAGSQVSNRGSIAVQPLTGSLGAEVTGVDLRDLDSAEFLALEEAFHRHGVLAVRGQELSLDDLKHFAGRFGDLEVHPIVDGVEGHPEVIKIHKSAGDAATFGVGWHSDNSFTERPSLCSIVYGVGIPPYGGDTLFANQYLAYERLSQGMRRLLDGLGAVHSARYAYTAPTTVDKFAGRTTMSYRRSEVIEAEVVHPVVRTHPVTGRRALYVNPMFTTRLEAMTEEESRPLLDYLFRHGAREDFQCRVRWQVGTVTLWDNRCVMHSALDDCQGFERIHFRVTVAGEPPI